MKRFTLFIGSDHFPALSLCAAGSADFDSDSPMIHFPRAKTSSGSSKVITMSKSHFLKGGDAGSVLNKAILSKDAPLGRYSLWRG